MHYYNFHIASWALHTAHLSLEEEAVYRRLIDYYYDTESPIPIETQSVIRRLRLGSHSVTVGLILQEFFTLEDDGWHNNRADIEIFEYKKRAKTAAENGKKGGRPRKDKGLETESVILANPDETQEKANKELIININNKKNIKKSSLTFTGWLKSLAENGEKPISESDPIFGYADEAGIPHDYLRITWIEFRAEFSSVDKRQKDWRAHFRNFVRKNYYKLWWIDNGEYKLTSRGYQAMIAMQSGDKKQ